MALLPADLAIPGLEYARHFGFMFLIYKRPATDTQPIIATVAARTGFLFVPLLGYYYSLPAT